MGNCKHDARVLRTFDGSLIAGPDVYVLRGPLLHKLGKCSGHVWKSGVKDNLLVAGKSLAFQRLLGLRSVVDHELYVSHSAGSGGVQGKNIHFRSADDTGDARQRPRSIVT